MEHIFITELRELLEKYNASIGARADDDYECIITIIIGDDEVWHTFESIDQHTI